MFFKCSFEIVADCLNIYEIPVTPCTYFTFIVIAFQFDFIGIINEFNIIYLIKGLAQDTFAYRVRVFNKLMTRQTNVIYEKSGLESRKFFTEIRFVFMNFFFVNGIIAKFPCQIFT